MSDEPKRAISENELSSAQKNLWDRAKKALIAKNTEYAVQLLGPIVKDNPLFVDGRKALRKCQMALGGEKKGIGKLGANAQAGMAAMKIRPMIGTDPNAALVAIEDSLASDPASIQLNDLLYEAAMAAGIPDLAVFALETLRDAHPRDKSAYLKLGDHYLKQKEGLLARKCFDKVSELDPADLDAKRRGMQASAMEAEQKEGWGKEGGAGKRDDKEALLLEKLSKQVHTPAEIEELLAYLLPKYAENNNNLLVVKQIAGLYEKAGDLSNAVAYYEWASHLAKGDSSLSAKVLVLKEKHRDSELKAMQSELEANPNAPDLEEKRAKMEELRRELFLQKVASAKDSVERNPTDPHLRFVLAQHLYDAGQYTEAIPELQRAKANPNVRIKALALLGQCFARKGMNDLAINQLKEAEGELHAMDDTKKAVIYERALLHDARGEKEEYLNALKLIYEVDYGFRDVAQRVESSYS